MQKMLVGWKWQKCKKFYFFNVKFTEAKFLQNFLMHNFICAIAFRADAGNNKKFVNFTVSCLYVRPIKVLGLLEFGSH